GEGRYRQAAPVLKELAEEHPRVARYLDELAECHARTAKAYGSGGNLKKGLASLEEAVRVREQLARAHPKEPAHVAALAGLQGLTALGYTVAERRGHAQPGGRPAVGVLAAP